MENDNTAQPSQIKTVQNPNPKTPRTVPLWAVILLAVALIGLGAVAYMWRDNQAKANAKKSQAEIAALQSKVEVLEKEAANESGAEEANNNTKKPSASDLENIEASITSGNTAALEGYMAPKVMVIIAASEGLGERTPAQAVSDLEYLDDADDPWDFSLPAATLKKWGNGDYKQYFPSDALVGKSADDMVISFTFNNAGKISGIFLAANADLL